MSRFADAATAPDARLAIEAAKRFPDLSRVLNNEDMTR